jgi:integrase
MASGIKITKSFVDACTGPGIYWDSELAGFGLRISGKTKSYVVQSRINGESKRQKIGKHGIFTAEEARKEARQMLASMARGVDPQAAIRARKIEGITLEEVFHDYLRGRKLAPRTEYDYKKFLTNYFADWRNRPIIAIKPAMVEQRHRELGATHGEAQANGAMRFLRAQFNFAEKYERANGDLLVAANPVRRLSASKLWFGVNRRETYIKEEQLKTWYEATVQIGKDLPGSGAEVIADYLLFVLFTGLRRTEASRIKWQNVDFAGRRFTVPREDTKNHTTLTLPLTSFTNDLLKRRYANSHSDFVFPGRGQSGHITEPKKQIAKLVEVTGIKFTIHDLRRTYATCADTVIDKDSTVKRLMNHLTGGQDVTEGYKQGVERLREPAQRVTDYMLCLIETGYPECCGGK